ncbi:MAG TPA: KamA family radical SAM protein [candidate division Zixibacteria bacterium]|nr:KamA family radical SAM protein [candidate division Zixibacteria bacterium]
MNWKDELSNNVTTVDELSKYILLDNDEKWRISKIIQIHPMSITRYYLSLIDPEDKDDPIRKIAIPSEGEFLLNGDYDTSGEHSNTKLAGLQHKYGETALLLTTNQCATYCRHCFRKRLVGVDTEEVLKRIPRAVGYIAERPEITNVLISGGDPLMLDNEVLETLLKGLDGIRHLKYIRIGTRIPVVFPMRIFDDVEFLNMVANFSHKWRRLYFVAHFNHPREITKESVRAVDALLSRGAIMSNQTVLLRGVNDDPFVLAKLQNKLTAIGVNPYYVFQCRPVSRVKPHFQVPLDRAYSIVERAKTMLDGHSKRFRFVMSHRRGKIEIVGIDGDQVLLKYHQAKDRENLGRVFSRRLVPGAGWLDDLEVEHVADNEDFSLPELFPPDRRN